MKALQKARNTALEALRHALEELPSRVPAGVEVICLVLAPGGTYLYFGACDRAMFDPEHGDVEEMIPFDGWEYSDEKLLESLQTVCRAPKETPGYGRCLRRIGHLGAREHAWIQWI